MLHGRRIAIGSKHHHRHGRIGGFEFRQCLGAGQFRHADIQEHHIGTQFMKLLQYLFPVYGLPHQFDAYDRAAHRHHGIDDDQWLIKRTVMWRPFIVDLRDTRLPRNQLRRYRLPLDGRAVAVEAVVQYHLLDEARRRRIGYQNTQPIAYEVYRHRVSLTP